MNEQYVLEADPKKPYKLYAAVAAGVLGSTLAYADVLPLWLVIVINSILGGLAVFLMPNPLRVKKSGASNQPPAYNGQDDAPLF